MLGTEDGVREWRASTRSALWQIPACALMAIGIGVITWEVGASAGSTHAIRDAASFVPVVLGFSIWKRSSWARRVALVGAFFLAVLLAQTVVPDDPPGFMRIVGLGLAAFVGCGAVAGIMTLRRPPFLRLTPDAIETELGRFPDAWIAKVDLIRDGKRSYVGIELVPQARRSFSTRWYRALWGYDLAFGPNYGIDSAELYPMIHNRLRLSRTDAPELGHE